MSITPTKPLATPAERSLENITVNMGGQAYRWDWYDGKQYMVAPMAMMTEGVHEGSQGPLYYSKDELSRNPSVWNHKPIIVNHPMADGKPQIACEPTVLEKRGVGLIFHGMYDDKLRAEAWIDPVKAKKIEPRIIEALENNQKMEVSIGVFSQNDKNQTGEFNGSAYGAAATNLQPEHLAILPDKEGACSIADGAGLLQTNSKVPVKNDAAKAAGPSMSHANIKGAIRDKMYDNWKAQKVVKASSDPTKTGTDSTDGGAAPSSTTSSWYDNYVEDVYHDFFIYSDNNGKMWKQAYEATGDQIAFKNDPSSVKRVTEYRSSLDNAFVGNSYTQVSLRELEMAEEKKVVANSTKTDDSGQSLADGKGGAPTSVPGVTTGSNTAADKATKLITDGTFGFMPEDKEWLSKLSESRLDTFLAQKLVTPASVAQAASQAGQQITTPPPTEVTDPMKKTDLTGESTMKQSSGPNANQSAATQKETTLVSNSTQTPAAPLLTNEEREVINEGLELRKESRAKYIETITANEQNKFTKEFLEKSDTGTLKNLAALAAPKDGGAPVANGQGAFFGAGGGAFTPVIFNEKTKPSFGEPLQAPKALSEPLVKK